MGCCLGCPRQGTQGAGRVQGKRVPRLANHPMWADCPIRLGQERILYLLIYKKGDKQETSKETKLGKAKLDDAGQWVGGRRGGGFGVLGVLGPEEQEQYVA